MRPFINETRRKLDKNIEKEEYLRNTLVFFENNYFQSHENNLRQIEVTKWVRLFVQRKRLRALFSEYVNTSYVYKKDVK